MPKLEQFDKLLLPILGRGFSYDMACTRYAIHRKIEQTESHNILTVTK